MILDNDDNNYHNWNCSVLLLCDEILKIIIDFLHILDLANLRFVCKRLREIALLNIKMKRYLTFSSRTLCSNIYNQCLKDCFDLIFERFSFYFDLADKLYFQYRVFHCWILFSVIKFCSISLIIVGLKHHLILVRRCSMLLIDKSSDSFFYFLFSDLLLIIILGLNFLKVFFLKLSQRFLLLRRTLGFLWKIFMNLRECMKLLNLLEKDVWSLLLFQSSLILLYFFWSSC